MNGGWWVLGIGSGLLGWAAYLDLRHAMSERLARRWVAVAREQGRWAGPAAFAISLSLLLAYVVVALVGAAIASSFGESAWALVTVLPALAAYAPFVWSTTPTKTGYWSWRDDLRLAGADPRLQRAIAWWAGPPSLLGLCASIGSLFAIFLG